jgi:hypothetical protein
MIKLDAHSNVLSMLSRNDQSRVTSPQNNQRMGAPHLDGDIPILTADLTRIPQSIRSFRPLEGKWASLKKEVFVGPKAICLECRRVWWARRSTTILDLACAGGGGDCPGRSLARFWDNRDSAVPASFEPLLMETDKPGVLTNQNREPVALGPMKSLVAGGMHYIKAGDGSEELYSLDLDPEERINLAGLPEAEVPLQGFRAGLRAMLRGRWPLVETTAGPLASHRRGE